MEEEGGPASQAISHTKPVLTRETGAIAQVREVQLLKPTKYIRLAEQGLTMRQ
jgi:hypothetical protein